MSQNHTPRMPDTIPPFILPKQLKADLLTKAEQVDRGLTETPEDRETILALIKKLEAANPTKK